MRNLLQLKSRNKTQIKNERYLKYNGTSRRTSGECLLQGKRNHQFTFGGIVGGVATELQKYEYFQPIANHRKTICPKRKPTFRFWKEGMEWPSQGMWSFHDNLREQFRLLRKNMDAENFGKINSDTPFLVDGINRLMNTESVVCFPIP